MAAFAAGGFLLSFLVNKVLLRFSTNLGIRSQEEFLVRWSSVSKPSLGGISFFITFLIALLAYSIAFGENDVFQNKSLLGLLIGCSLAFVMGLADDAYNTRPLLKLLIQIAIAVTFIVSGAYIEFSDYTYINYGLTVVWVVGIMNSINMLDNMDGISTVTTISILISCFASFLIFSNDDLVFPGMVICMIFTLIAFLFFNWNPAKMFMGDSGSQFIGALIAFMGIKYLWNAPLSEGDWSWPNLILVLVAFAPTLIDTTIVSILRLAKGKSPMVGGKDHSTHALTYLGFSDKKVGFVFVLLGLVSVLLSISICLLADNEIWIYSFGLYFLICFTILFVITRKYNEKKDIEG
jgi:UDP-GlcNAc:undecaprenyl-phosphate GlcNAc-1-phosphate transferase